MGNLKDINIFNNFKRYSKRRMAIPQQVWSNPLYFIAFGLGTGTIPFAPGTFGTLLAIPCFIILQSVLPFYWYLAFVGFFIIFSSWLCERISREIKLHDHPGMNIDEFTGYFVTMIGAPFGLGWAIVGFVLFRLFDIWKPWPIDIIDEKVHGGFGMVLDDIVAGIFAMIIIQYLKVYFS